jgi:DNA-binding MarR family transcriptional regulator
MSSAAIAIDPAALASQLRLSVHRLARKLRREGRPEATPTLLSALATVERHGPLTAGSLAQHEQVTKPTCTRLIGALMEQNLVERSSDPSDGRVAWLQITSEGRRTLSRVRHRKDAYLAARMRQLTPDELETLERATEILERLTSEDEPA